MDPREQPYDDRPEDNIEENADASGDAGDIDELKVPEGVDD